MTIRFRRCRTTAGNQGWEGSIVAPPLDFYFEFASPYGYFASLSIDAIAAAHGAR